MTIPMLPIDDGTKSIPPRNFFKHRYPWRLLKVGQSFTADCKEWEAEKMFNSLTSCARHATYKTGFKFTMRRILGGIRVWRIY